MYSKERFEHNNDIRIKYNSFHKYARISDQDSRWGQRLPQEKERKEGEKKIKAHTLKRKRPDKMKFTNNEVLLGMT